MQQDWTIVRHCQESLSSQHSQPKTSPQFTQNILPCQHRTVKRVLVPLKNILPTPSQKPSPASILKATILHLLKESGNCAHVNFSHRGTASSALCLPHWWHCPRCSGPSCSCHQQPQARAWLQASAPWPGNVHPAHDAKLSILPTHSSSGSTPSSINYLPQTPDGPPAATATTHPSVPVPTPSTSPA